MEIPQKNEEKKKAMDEEVTRIETLSSGVYVSGIVYVYPLKPLCSERNVHEKHRMCTPAPTFRGENCEKEIMTGETG